jgi:uncharacterized membrane-anchored protein YhcB (DUF1043 family)
MDPFSIIGYIFGAGVGILALFSRIPKQTIDNQKDLIASYEKRFADMDRQRVEDLKQHNQERVENAKAIADLQGQIKVYKELPLQEMAKAMEEISRVNKGIADSNTEILKTLKNSALIAAEDKLETHTETTQTIKAT